MAALLKKETGAESDLVEGGRGEFTVWVGEKQVAQKNHLGFPADADVLAAVQKELARPV